MKYKIVKSYLAGPVIVTMDYILLVAIVFVGWSWTFLSKRNMWNSSYPYVKPLRRIKQEYKQYLQMYFLYYQGLEERKKRLFESRVQAFIDSKKYIPRGYTHVNDEMKALIAGAAIQLTFGFRHLNFSHFSRILVYPDDYYSRITRKYHQGEVNPNGLIILSWRNFVQGYEKSNDGKNLGLHEMAHALRLENAIDNGEYDFIDPSVIWEFDELANEEIKRIKAGSNGFFRSYAASNIHEFFAVAVENFFERPEEFYQYHPRLYMNMVQKLRQDPRKMVVKV